jgi:hypothetical protein
MALNVTLAVVVALAQAITTFVGRKVSGATLSPRKKVLFDVLFIALDS